jgi:predicted short-subunit dehydrogenase-like oxidoreductase (DUF2520 family)
MAHLLRDAGHHIVGVASRSPASAERAAAALGANTFEIEAGGPACDLAVVATSDDAIEEATALFARHIMPGTVVCHLAGSRGTEPLRAASKAGARLLALHPVASCPSVEAARRRLPGCSWAVTCAPDLHPWATALVERDLGGRAVSVREEDRVVWHAAAVLSANVTSAVMSACERLLARIDVAQPGAVLGPLCSGVVANAQEAGGAGAALTGPVVRGDTATLVAHARALQERAPDIAEIYGLSMRAVALAAQQLSRLDTGQCQAMWEALESM